MATVRNELRADLRITGDNAVKAGLRGVARAADDAGDELRDMGRDAGYLERKLAELRIAQLALVKELNQTGDVTLIRDINKARRDVRQFERLTRELAADSAQAGVAAGIQFTEGFAGALKVAGPLVAGIGVLVAGLLPGLGAAVAGVVSGAVGAGGIVGGVIAAAHDPKIKPAFKELLGILGQEFKDAGQPLVEPLLDALGVLRDDGRTIAADLATGFATLAPELVPLTKGLTGLVKEMMPGLLAAFESARPVLRAMSAELPKIGAALGKFFEITGEDSEGAVMGFIALSRAIEHTLVYAGMFLRTMAKSFQATIEFGAVATEVVDKAIRLFAPLITVIGPLGDVFLGINKKEHDLFQHLIDDTGQAMQETGAFTYDVRKMGDAFDEAAEKVKETESAISELFGAQMGIEEATVRWAKGLRDLKEALGNGRKTLKLNTEDGIENREALLEQIRAAEDFREAQINMQIPMDQANAKYLEHIESIRNLAIKAGFARDEVDAFIKKFLEIPDAKTIQLNFRAGADAASWAALRALERQQSGGVTMGPMTVVPARAAGGPVAAGRGYIVGENGPEFFSPTANGYVSSASQTASMMSGASGGSRPQVSISLQPSGNAAMDALVQAIWPYLLRQIRVDGGDLSALGAA